MKRRLHLIAFALFVLCFIYDLVVWGAVRDLPEMAADITASAHREAPLASTYIFLGGPLDAAVPFLRSAGLAELADALVDGLPRLREQPTAALDLIFATTWNSTHRRLKTLYWAAPLLLLISAVLWWRRPRPIRLMGARR